MYRSCQQKCMPGPLLPNHFPSLKTSSVLTRTMYYQHTIPNLALALKTILQIVSQNLMAVMGMP